MVMIYFWDAGLCPHLSSCECWHVLGTGKVYIAWIPGDWFRATHFEAVGQIKPMLTPPGKLSSKINMVSSSALGQCPQENQPSLWFLFLLPPQSLVGRGQWAFAGIVLYFVYVCYVYVFAYARVPSPPLLPQWGIRAALLSSQVCWWRGDLGLFLLWVSIPRPQWDSRWLISVTFWHCDQPVKHFALTQTRYDVMTRRTITTLNNFYLMTIVMRVMAGQFTLSEHAFLSDIIHSKL